MPTTEGDDLLGRFPCRYSFSDLFRAATGRTMTVEERTGFRSLSQPEKNRKVKELCALTDGRFVWEDRTGVDGRTYTAFGTPRQRDDRPARRPRARSGRAGTQTSP